MSVQDGHKTMARALRRALKTKGVELGHGECLELVAKTFGFASWNVLVAQTGGHDTSHADSCAFCGLLEGEVPRLLYGPTCNICERCVTEMAEGGPYREVMERLDEGDDLEAYLNGKTPAELESVIAIARDRYAEKQVAIAHLAALADGTPRTSVRLAPGVETIRWETLAKRPKTEVAAMRDVQRERLALTRSAIETATLVLNRKSGPG